MGPNISSVNILILNQGYPINNIIPLPESPSGCMVTPPGPWTNHHTNNASFFSLIIKFGTFICPKKLSLVPEYAEVQLNMMTLF